MVNSDPTVFSLLSSACSFNVSKYSFILAFSVLFGSQVYRSVPFSRISKSCLKWVVLCMWAPRGDAEQVQLKALPGQTSVMLLSPEELPRGSAQSWLSFFPSFLRGCGTVVALVCVSCLCVCLLKVCQNCQLVYFPLLISCYSCRAKAGWKAGIFLLLICPSPDRLIGVLAFCWLSCS